MTPIPNHPCAHPDCGCKVEQQGEFCSDFCRGRSDTRDGNRCECGHSDCIVEEALERAEQV